MTDNTNIDLAYNPAIQMLLSNELIMSHLQLPAVNQRIRSNKNEYKEYDFVKDLEAHLEVYFVGQSPSSAPLVDNQDQQMIIEDLTAFDFSNWYEMGDNEWQSLIAQQVAMLPDSAYYFEQINNTSLYNMPELSHFILDKLNGLHDLAQQLDDEDVLKSMLINIDRFEDMMAVLNVIQTLAPKVQERLDNYLLLAQSASNSAIGNLYYQIAQQAEKIDRLYQEISENVFQFSQMMINSVAANISNSQEEQSTLEQFNKEFFELVEENSDMLENLQNYTNYTEGFSTMNAVELFYDSLMHELKHIENEILALTTMLNQSDLDEASYEQQMSQKEGAINFINHLIDTSKQAIEKISSPFYDLNAGLKLSF